MPEPSPLSPVKQRYDRLRRYGRTPDNSTFVLTHQYGEAHLGFADGKDIVEITPTPPVLTLPQWKEFSEWMTPAVAIAEQDTAHYYRQQHINWEQYGLVRIISDTGETKGLPIWVAAGQETFPYGTPYLIWRDDQVHRNDTTHYTWIGCINGISHEELILGKIPWDDTVRANSLAKKILLTPEETLICAALINIDTVTTATTRNNLHRDIDALWAGTTAEHHCDEDGLAGHILRYYADHTEHSMPNGYIIDILTPDRFPRKTFPYTPFLILHTNTGNRIDWLTDILHTTPYHVIPWSFTDPYPSAPILVAKNPELLNLITPTLTTYLQESLNEQFRRRKGMTPFLHNVLPRIVEKTAVIVSAHKNAGGNLHTYSNPIPPLNTRPIRTYYAG